MPSSIKSLYLLKVRPFNLMGYHEITKEVASAILNTEGEKARGPKLVNATTVRQREALQACNGKFFSSVCIPLHRFITGVQAASTQSDVNAPLQAMRPSILWQMGLRRNTRSRS